ncbi:MAG: nucleotidyltransferase family protein [Rhodobacteraceae bacterium]|nr:nucleotidyltransferase family protein [Paracoccaceae bacterium]
MAKTGICLILLAAGGSTRMRGADKLLQQIDGEALLRRSARAACDSKAEPVLVVLRPDDAARLACLTGLAVTPVISLQWQDGLSASIRAGLAACPPDCTGVLLALADMPDIRACDLDVLVAAFPADDPGAICRAAMPDGSPGNPVLFGRDHIPALAALKGDAGARDLLQRHRDRTRLVALPGQRARIDLDSPEDWESWVGTRD